MMGRRLSLDPMDFHVDTLDVFAISLGGLIGLALLPEDPGWLVERVVVSICVLVVITAKRLFVPTAPGRQDTSVLTRMLFLFLSIVGTACTFGGFALAMFYVPELETPRPGWPEGRLQHVLVVSGFGLLGVSAILDRLFLKRAA